MMQIHVVQSGDTLFSIAQIYHISTQDIMKANELDTTHLVIGQSLVIPINNQYYFIKQGDSLYSISEKFNISIQQLSIVNNIAINAILPIGLRLYIPAQSKREIASFGYIEPFGDTVSQTMINTANKHTPSLTFLAPFSYTINRDGSLNAPPLDNFIKIAKDNNAYASLVITNLKEGMFDSDLVHIILTVKAVQNKLLDHIINISTEVGFSDVHFDFEFIHPEDKDAYNEFLQKAKNRLSQAGLLLSTALAPKTNAGQQGSLYEGHDYKTHGKIADFTVIMTYEWGYSYGPPLPVSPINEVEKVLQYALTEIPANKIFMGQNLYGYDWTLPFIQGESFAKAISPQQALQIARQHNATINYDKTAQAPYFHYIDDDGSEHEVWFEDARSIQAKFDLIKRLNLRGIAYWKLGLNFPQNWLLLNDNFSIEKRN